MEQSYIRGIVYTVHDNKIGPVAYAWTPVGLSEELLDKVSWEMSISNDFTDTDRIMKPLVVFPLPTYKLKMLVKHFDYRDGKLRGGGCATTLALLFNEENDLIFYKFMPDFSALFDKYVMEINEIQEEFSELQESKGRREKIQQKVNEFNNELQEVIKNLYSQEMEQTDDSAFPEVDSDAEIKVTAYNKFKVIVCGDPAVGKTSLIHQFTHHVFKRTYMNTIGVVLTEKLVTIDDEASNLILWDVAGQAKYNTFRKQFYTGACGVILVYDVTNPPSFYSIKKWYKDVSTCVGDIEGVIIGNKIDLVEERKVLTEELEQLGSELGFAVFVTSAMTGENVENAFKNLAEKLVKSV